MTGYVFKSKALKAQNEKNAQQEADARATLVKLATTYEQSKQTTEELDGQRGTNRAIRQKDFSSLAGIMLNVENYKQNGGSTADAIDAIIADMLEFKRQIIALSVKKGRG